MHRQRILLLYVLASLGLSAQQAAGPLPIQPYSRKPDAANVSYGPHERNVLDFWRAKSDRPAALVIYFHPGGFTHGDKSWFEYYDQPLMEMCLAHGISVASANYRYVQQAPLPAAMLDCARSIQFLRYHAKEYNLNPKAVIAAGSSAGAMTSMYLGLHDDMADPKSDDPVNRQSTRVCAVGSIDGAPLLDPRMASKYGGGSETFARQMLPRMFGVSPDELYTEKAYRIGREVSPLTYLTRDDAPVFLYYTHDVSDQPPPDKNAAIHNPRFGALLKEPMDKLGVECIFRTPKDYPRGARRPFTKEMFEFFVKYLR